MPEEQKITRKLRAILSADVKGYSLLMADDEVHTIQTLKAYREIMSDLIQQHSGRVVDNPGDNLLAEFSSAVDAVEAAIQIQKNLKKENAKFVEDKRLQFRIGVNIGDVVHDGDRIYGEGVNIAARIESLADAGSVCISRNTYDHIKNKIQLETEYLGEHDVKNINESVRVYKILMKTESHKPLVEEQLELPDKPSIAVLPFTNMSGDSSQEYFSDGLTESIINGLCKISNLFVIARNSSFTYKGKAINVKQVGTDLGVRYVLEGSVQKSSDILRITAQLIDTKTGYHLWSEIFDREVTDVFALQDEITLKIMDTMRIKLTTGEQARLWAGMTNSIMAYDMYMQGNEYYLRNNEKDNRQARKYFKEAIIIDNSYAIAYASLGYTHICDLAFGWTKESLKSFEEAEKNVEKALALNDSLDIAHGLRSWIYLIKRQYDEAIKEGERAIELNPNGAVAHAIFGFTLFSSDKTELSIKILKRAFQLNPFPPSYYYTFLAMAYRNNREYDKAIEMARKGLHNNTDQITPNLVLAASYSFTNRNLEASEAAKEILRIDPSFSLEYYSSIIPYKNQETKRKYVQALRKAGLPD